MSHYTPSYCEENVWWLAHELPQDARADVVFVTNEARTVAVWSQRAASRAGAPVVWDYHVVLARHGETTTVVDLDCTLGPELPAARWLEVSFPIDVEPRLRPTFRVVDAHRFARVFRSDRSHMRTADGWLAPPPPWPPITAGDGDLARFLDLSHPVATTRSRTALASDWAAGRR